MARSFFSPVMHFFHRVFITQCIFFIKYSSRDALFFINFSSFIHHVFHPRRHPPIHRFLSTSCLVLFRTHPWQTKRASMPGGKASETDRPGGQAGRGRNGHARWMDGSSCWGWQTGWPSDPMGIISKWFMILG